MNSFRGIMNHYAFNTEPKKSVQLDSNKPLVVPVGRDSVEKIGFPPGCTPSDPVKKVNTAWQDILDDYFPRGKNGESKDAEKEEDDAENDGNSQVNRIAPLDLSSEPIVDACRKQKDRELEEYRQKVARAQRLKNT
eukprot:CAMPEP_0203801416 /NCGR_PEP_ID=MMETSP0100_2-20121128/11285_1 /ASSEMBLY_ACC=CAM_ASM_000210 /TAXON_ID=96639 /ORGANISM=" , Strain NY0313808BC1" /LENGTH=135 /DNA_ID=CAMNT_0050708057 /DNA_START=92 /DNA_END=502 /DNA_ORIENTATION=-